MQYLSKLRIMGTFITMLIFATSVASATSSNFKMSSGKNKTLKFKKRIVQTDTLVPLEAGSVDGLSITATVKRKSELGFARVLLVDAMGNEYLVMETNSMLDSQAELSFNGHCEETCTLGNVQVSALRFEVDAAQIMVNGITVADVEARSERKMKARATMSVGKSEFQQKEKLKKIKNSIKMKGLKWVAGETPVSRMPYAQKRKLFGGKLPNLSGFEYYTGGIFQIPSAEDNGSSSGDGVVTYSPYVDEFSWKYKHGQDWVSPVANQGGCGSCWAFAATASTELLTNLYFNDHLDLDLAEQDGLSCTGSGSCTGGWPGLTLDHYTTNGVVEEACFPYTASDQPCGDKCSNPTETVRIGGRTAYYSYDKNDDDLKALIIEGVVSGGVFSWRHAMVLVGYKVLEAGDYIYLRSQNGINWISIPEGDPLVGRTAWHFKNSWGSSWGDGGYVYVVMDHNDIGWTHSVHGPVTTLNHSISNIVCEDEDGDDYYNWGIGVKPAHCPAQARPLPDGDDANPCFGPMDEFGRMEDLCDNGSVINLGVEHVVTYFTAGGTTALEITDWTDWGNWTPGYIYIAVRPEDGYVMDGLHLTVGGVTTALSGWWQSVPVPYDGQEKLEIQLYSPSSRNVSMDWWSQN